MGRARKQQELEMALSPLLSRMEDWRAKRRTIREPIPKQLWKASAEAAVEYGVAAVSNVLRLDYYKLKSQVDELYI